MGSSVDKVYICNLALSRCGARKRINDVTEATHEAQLCNLHYDQALEDALEDGDFGWAKKRATLSLSASTTIPSGTERATDEDSAWGYKYALPSDCLRPLIIDDQLQIRGSDQRVPFSVENLDGVEVLYTDQEDAVLIYAARITDTSLFSRKFASLVAWKLASHVAHPLTGKTALADRAEQQSIIARDEAIAFDFQRDQEPEEPDASWVRARGGWGRGRAAGSDWDSRF